MGSFPETYNDPRMLSTGSLTIQWMMVFGNPVSIRTIVIHLLDKAILHFTTRACSTKLLIWLESGPSVKATLFIFFQVGGVELSDVKP